MRVSPDGRAVVLIRATQDPAQSWSCDSRGQEEPKRLSDPGGQPAWSADGKGLITPRGETTPEDHWKMVAWRFNADGSGATRLPVPDMDFVNDVSPNARRFVTCSDRHPPRARGRQRYLMHPDGTGQRRLTQGAGLNCTARFSPAGRQ